MLVQALPLSSDKAAAPARLGGFLTARRAALSPESVGLPCGRRRTPGLKREEVALLSGVSTTWYTWLEQGRPVRASAEALERIAGTLQLDRGQREHLFLLAHDRPPPRRTAEEGRVTPTVQRLLDALPYPAYVKNSCWDVLAWNAAAAAVLTDYGALPPAERNIIRLLFTRPNPREAMPDWDREGPQLLAVLRADRLRGGGEDAQFDALVEELTRKSADFAAWWPRPDLRGLGEGIKHVDHPRAGPLQLQYTAVTLDSAPDLGLVVYMPSREEDAAAIAFLLEADLCRSVAAT